MSQGENCTYYSPLSSGSFWGHPCRPQGRLGWLQWGLSPLRPTSPSPSPSALSFCDPCCKGPRYLSAGGPMALFSCMYCTHTVLCPLQLWGSPCCHIEVHAGTCPASSSGPSWSLAAPAGHLALIAPLTCQCSRSTMPLLLWVVRADGSTHTAPCASCKLGSLCQNFRT